MAANFYTITRGNSPLVASAIHDGHDVREEVRNLFALDHSGRLREEDPFTGRWTHVAENRIIVSRSRFEVDLNRPKEKAVYIVPEDAWGLNVWKEPLDRDIINRSYAQFDAFYKDVESFFKELQEKFGKFVLFDIHTYNHHRQGPNAPFDDPEANPEVNIGTGTMVREKWAPIVDRFITDLRNFDFGGRNLDVRENIKFKGGNLSRWTHETFPESGCSIAIEFKKFFMDEWTGVPDEAQVQLITDALASTVPGVMEEFSRL